MDVHGDHRGHAGRKRAVFHRGGALLAAALTASLVGRVGATNLLLFSAGLLELGAQCVRRFPAQTRAGGPVVLPAAASERPIGGPVWAGITHEFRSPYLLGISGYMLLYSITSTVLYFQQATLAAHHFHGSAARSAFFAQLDLAVNVLTILVQCFFTSQLLRRLGVGLTLALAPVISVAGFVALGFAPVISVFVVFQILRRAANFAVSRPAREILFTVLSREDKYKAKSFLDTFIYRAGDQIGAWSYPAVAALGLGFAGTSFVAAPLAVLWCILSLWLGKKHLALFRQAQRGPEDPPAFSDVPQQDSGQRTAARELGIPLRETDKKTIGTGAQAVTYYRFAPPKFRLGTMEFSGAVAITPVREAFQTYGFSSLRHPQKPAARYDFLRISNNHNPIFPSR